MKKTYLSLIILIVIFTIWLIVIPGSWRDQINAIGYAFCHRIPSHSNHIGETPYSFCARCYGMYFGALLGFIYLHIIAKKRAGLPQWYTYIFVVIFFILFAIDGINSTITTILGRNLFYQTSNITRQITGLGIGMSLSIFLSYALNETLWKERSQTPIIKSFLELIGLFLTLSAGFAIFFINSNFIHEILNIASTIGFVITLSSIIIIIILMVRKKENSFETLHSTIPYIILSVSIALLIILSIDLARFWLTHTWQGFNL